MEKTIDTVGQGIKKKKKKNRKKCGVMVSRELFRLTNDEIMWSLPTPLTLREEGERGGEEERERGGERERQRDRQRQTQRKRDREIVGMKPKQQCKLWETHHHKYCSGGRNTPFVSPTGIHWT